MSPLLVDLTLAGLPFAVGMAATWQLIWPRWKVVGKGLTYFGLVAVGSIWIGHVVVVLAWLHQALGLFVHIWFSRRHGFTWYAVEDPERYVELSKAMVGYDSAPREPRRSSLDGVELPPPRTPQTEGEPAATVEWSLPHDPDST